MPDVKHQPDRLHRTRILAQTMQEADLGTGGTGEPVEGAVDLDTVIVAHACLGLDGHTTVDLDTGDVLTVVEPFDAFFEVWQAYVRAADSPFNLHN